MKIETKEDEKGKPIFCVGKFIFYSFEDALKKLRELKEKEAKKEKAETNNETKNNGRNH